MKFSYLFIFIIVLIHQFKSQELTLEQVEEFAKMHTHEMDMATITLKEQQNIQVKQYAANLSIYELNIEPVKLKKSKKHNEFTSEMCYATQQQLKFFETVKSWAPAFPEYMDDSGNVIYSFDRNKPIPMLINYVKYESGIYAIDSYKNLVKFDVTGEDEYNLEIHRADFSLNYDDIVKHDPLYENFKNQYPTLVYHKHHVYLLWNEVAYFFKHDTPNQIFPVHGFDPVEHIHRARIGFIHGFTHAYTGENVENLQPILMIAGGTSGALFYQFNNDPTQLSKVSIDNISAELQNPDVQDIDHFPTENEVFVLDKNQGVRRITFYNHSPARAIMDSDSIFQLKVTNGKRMGHFTKIKKFRNQETNEIKVLATDQSFLIISEANDFQYVTEYDNKKSKDGKDTWWQAQKQQYGSYFDFKDLLVHDSFAILIGNHFSQTIRHSIFHKFSNEPFHEKTKVERVKAELQNIVNIPGQIDSDFFSNQLLPNHRPYASMHQYIIGISAHNAFLVGIKDVGPKLHCELEGIKLKQGTYVYNVTLYENVCVNPETNEITDDDYSACQFNQLLAIKLEKDYKEDLPWWAILLIVIFSLFILAGFAFTCKKVYEARKQQKQNSGNIQTLEGQINDLKSKQAQYQQFKDQDDDLESNPPPVMSQPPVTNYGYVDSQSRELSNKQQQEKSPQNNHSPQNMEQQQQQQQDDNIQQQQFQIDDEE